MKQRPIVGIINTLKASGGNVDDDTTALHYTIVEDNSADPLDAIFEPIPYGKTVRVEYFDSQAEVQQVVKIGAGDEETIVADTRYKIEIHNPDVDYETMKQQPAVHAFTSPATLSGDADTDRATVYSALITKINNYAGNNTTAYEIIEFDFTLGGATGNDEPSVGDTLTQQTSGATAKVAEIGTLTSGTWAGGDAAGTMWLWVTSGTPTDGALTWSYASSTLTQTNATFLNNQGLVIEDDASYFWSSKSRGGVSYVGATEGFTTAEAEVIIAGVYSMGIGSEMAVRGPQYDPSKQDAQEGRLEFEFVHGDTPDTAKTFTKCVITVNDGDEDALGGDKIIHNKEFILYVEEDSGLTNRDAFKTALNNAIAK
jgi:hypothetical protein